LSRPARFHVAIAVVLAALLTMAWVGRVHSPSRLQQIRERGTLVVATRIGPATYYDSSEGPRGFEYGLVKGFAKRLGVKLEIRPVDSMQQLATLLDAGAVDLVAAGIGPTPRRLERFTFATPYMTVQPEVVYRRGTPEPDNLGDLAGHSVEVIAGSGLEQRLSARRSQYPDLKWHALTGQTSEELLYRVWSGRTEYAVTDSNKVLLNQHFYPELQTGFHLGDPRKLAWMLRPGDNGLLEAANRYIASAKNEGTVDALVEQYYGHLGKFDYVGTRRFMRDVADLLPTYRPVFERAAKADDMDWRLLAAVGYQESHWDPHAESPTGVRGVMMLTQDAAQDVGVDNRLDAKESIRGGADYLSRIRSRLPDDVSEPVRTWFALAAYNVGFGHLEDARVITQMQGGDPDSWAAVKKRLPLLSQKKWYSKVDHGYARGWEPVRYVENIRKYYQLLIRVTEPSLLKVAPGPKKPSTPESPRDWGLNDQSESAL